MKKLSLLLFMVTLLTSAFAQKQAQYEKVAAKNHATWVDICELTDQQSKDLLVVLTEKQKEMYEAKMTHKTDKTAFKAKAKEINKSYGSKLKSIVGEDNMKKMLEYRKSQKNKG
ncbi:hypothetical protein E9993_12735 [Labilibacter sediminis]|nr:hypothetical protein E9993_12735 [Labilibacter sediminis]